MLITQYEAGKMNTELKLIGADIQKRKIQDAILDSLTLKPILYDNNKISVEIKKAVQCGMTEGIALRARLNHMYRDCMLSDIKKKRTPDYVKTTMRKLNIC